MSCFFRNLRHNRKLAKISGSTRESDISPFGMCVHALVCVELLKLTKNIDIYGAYTWMWKIEILTFSVFQYIH